MDTLHIRLSLVGSMFDYILVCLFALNLVALIDLRRNFLLKKNNKDFENWAWLFVQLIYSGVIDPDNDQILFTMVIDMLAVLIHHIVTLDPNLENNKSYQNIVKRINKETKDFNDMPNSKAINHV